MQWGKANFVQELKLVGLTSSEIKFYFYILSKAYIGVFPKWSRTFAEFRKTDKSLKHELGLI